MNWKFWIVAPLSLFLLGSGCSDCNHPDPFSIRVTDPAGSPVAGVAVSCRSGSEGGFKNSYPGFHHLDYRTNADGYVTIPGANDGWKGSLLKDDYYPSVVTYRPDAVYSIEPTPLVADSVGFLEGDRFWFIERGIISLANNGAYRYYPLYGADLGLPVVSTALAGATMRSVLLEGNRLWISYSNDPTVTVDISIPAFPRVIARQQPPEPISIRAGSDSLIIALNAAADRLLILEPDGDSLFRVSTIVTQGASKVRLRGRTMILLNGNGRWIYDLSLPIVPRLISGVQTNEQAQAIFLDSLMALRVYGSDWQPDSSAWDIYDISDPVVMRRLETLSAPGSIRSLNGLYAGFLDNHAIGSDYSYSRSYELPNGGVCAIERQIGSNRFRAKGYKMREFAAGSYPYVIAGGQVTTLYRFRGRT